MVEDINKSEVEERASDVSEAMTGKPIVDEDPQESPLAKVERLNKETKETLEEIKKQREEMEQTLANNMLGGQAYAGTPSKKKTQDETDQETANEMMGVFK